MAHVQPEGRRFRKPLSTLFIVACESVFAIPLYIFLLLGVLVQYVSVQIGLEIGLVIARSTRSYL